jgi:hypothetical protein
VEQNSRARSQATRASVLTKKCLWRRDESDEAAMIGAKQSPTMRAISPQGGSARRSSVSEPGLLPLLLVVVFRPFFLLFRPVGARVSRLPDAVVAAGGVDR